MGSKAVMRRVRVIEQCLGTCYFRNANVKDKFLIMSHKSVILRSIAQPFHGATSFHIRGSLFRPNLVLSHGFNTLLSPCYNQRSIPACSYKTSSRNLKDFTSQPDKTQSSDVENEANIKTEKEASTQTSLTIFGRFKNAYKEYGKVLVCVHVATSAIWYGAFFYAARSGIDVVPLLVKMGAGESIIKPFQSTGAGNFAVAYLLYKIATPVRYTVTIGGTQLTVRQLRNMGYMEKPSQEDSLRNLVKQGRTQMKDQVEKVKDRMEDVRDNVKDRFEDMRDNVKDRVDDVRDNVKDRFEDIKDNVKDKGNVKEKVDDIRGNLKGKVEDLKDNKRLQNLKESTKDRLDDVKDDFKESLGKLKKGGTKR